MTVAAELLLVAEAADFGALGCFKPMVANKGCRMIISCKLYKFPTRLMAFRADRSLVA